MKLGNIIEKPNNTNAKCKCGKIAKFKTEIQINQFRGDDEVFWSCDEHKKDCAFLIGNGVSND